MKLQLKEKTNAIIETDDIKEISEVTFYEVPDVYIQSWFTYSISYKNGQTIHMYYDTRIGAENDLKFILENVKL